MKNVIRALLVDDEIPALELMRELLSAHPEVEVVGQARSVNDAASLAEALKPDLIFLDIQMPREDGFALLPRLSHPAVIVFVTAYDTHAIRAFEVNAVDYLLKPVHPARLAQTLARLRMPVPPANQGPLGMDDRFFFKTDHGLRTADVKAITHIEAEENYTFLHLEDGRSHLLRRTLAEWEKLLPSRHFARVERSLLVGLHAILDLHVKSRDEALLLLRGREQPLCLARRASLRLRQMLDSVFPSL